MFASHFQLDHRDDASELEFIIGDRTVCILPNPKDEHLILAETGFNSSEARELLTGEAALAVLHRLNGEAMLIKDWRFVLDEDDMPLLRASFKKEDFETAGAAEALLAEAIRFADLAITLA
jgi:hypothetical protein